MKKAKLVKLGKGWRLEGEKSMPVPSDFGLTDDMEGQEVEFDNTGGPVKLIRYQGKDYTKVQKQDMGSRRDQRGGGQYSNRGHAYSRRQHHGREREQHDPARAPYNFVPLNEEVVPGQEGVDFDRFAGGRLSGFVNIDITAISDIFVRGQLESFFSVNENFAIPGSTLRGLIRYLVEIASCSKMEMVEKKRKLFFRNISDPFYKDIFLDVNNGNGDVKQKSKVGWLSKSGDKYFLQEVPNFYKVSRRKLNDIGLDLEDVYATRTVWFDPKKIKKIHHKEIRRNGRIIKRLQLHYNKVGSISPTDKPEFEKATLLVTGLFGRNKHFQWIIPDPDSKSRRMDVTSILQEYEMDESRDEKANLIKALKNSGKDRIPCFFICNHNENPVAIGHTGIFRYPYKYQIDHAVKQKNQPAKDIASSIFGYANSDNRSEKILAGKVWFEDAYAEKVTGTEVGALRILSSPKPTSFQLYLEQPKNQEHHWGTDEHKIRGYKMYWHTTQDWRHPENKNLLKAKTHKELIQMAFKEKNTQFTLGEVLKAGSTFLGRIRFENLTKEELGALLFVLDLPESCAHKLGMGKPLGLGSVKITPTLTLVNRHKRYSSIFDENADWESGESKEENLKQFKDAFAQYIGEKLSNSDIKDAESFWTLDERMQELRHMLTLEHNMSNRDADWNTRTKYMEIEHPQHGNEYRGRPVLPKPSEVVQPHTYKKR